MDWFLGTIKYIKEQSANIVIILKTWLSIKGLKVVKNAFKVFYFQVFKLKLIIRAFINLLKDFFASSLLQSKINQLICLLNLFLDLLRFSQVCLVDQYPFLPHTKYFQLVCLRGYTFIQELLRELQMEFSQYGYCQRQRRFIKQVSELVYRFYRFVTKA